MHTLVIRVERHRNLSLLGTHQKPQWELDIRKEKEACLNATRRLGDVKHSDWDGGRTIAPQMGRSVSLEFYMCHQAPAQACLLSL